MDALTQIAQDLRDHIRDDSEFRKETLSFQRDFAKTMADMSTALLLLPTKEDIRPMTQAYMGIVGGRNILMGLAGIVVTLGAAGTIIWTILGWVRGQ